MASVVNVELWSGCGAWIMNYLIFTLLLPPPAKRLSHMKDQWRLWSITLICASDICRLCLTVRHRRLAHHGVLKHSDGQIYGHRQGARGWPRSPGKKLPLTETKEWEHPDTAAAAETASSESHWLGVKVSTARTRKRPILSPVIRMHPIWLRSSVRKSCSQPAGISFQPNNFNPISLQM